MNSRIRRPLYISFKSWLCCCSLPTVAPQQLPATKLPMDLYKTETFPVESNRSIEFWTEISGNCGWMDCASPFPVGPVGILVEWIAPLVFWKPWPVTGHIATAFFINLDLRFHFTVQLLPSFDNRPGIDILLGNIVPKSRQTNQYKILR